MSGFGGFSFGNTSTTTANTQASSITGGFSAFGATTNAPSFGSTTNAPSFGSTTNAPSFGSTTNTSAFSATTNAPSFGGIAATQQPATGSLFNLSGTTNTAQPSLAFNFGNQQANKPATSTPAFGSGLFSTATTQPQTTTQTTQANSSFNFNLGGTSLPTTSTGAFSLNPTQTTQTTSFLGNQQTSLAQPTSTALNSTSTGLNLTTTANKPASTGFNLSFNVASTQPSSTAPLTTNLSTSTTQSSLITNPQTTNTGLTAGVNLTTSSTSAQQTNQQSNQQQTNQQPAQMTFKQLEGYINVWLNELNQMEKDFQTQSQTINSWDSLLVNNGLKISNVNESLDVLKEEHKRIDQQLDFVISQQNELEQLLEPLEKIQVDFNVNDTATTEREFTYSLVDTVSNDLQGIGNELQNFIKKLNESKASQDANDPLSSIGKILNSHLDALQYIEHQINVLKKNVET